LNFGALHWAAEKNHLGVVFYLLQNGSLPSASDERDKSAFDLTASSTIKDWIKKAQEKKYLCVRFEFPFPGVLANYTEILKRWNQNKK
jgi:hypothetical protein